MTAPENEESGTGERVVADGTAVTADAPGGDALSPEDVFEHLTRLRSGISDGVITPW